MSSTHNFVDANPDRSRDSQRFHLLENGEEYFPAVFDAIAAARREVAIETFILFEDAIGRRLQTTLIAAARRGVRVDLTVDGYGSPDLTDTFIEAMAVAGVRVHIYDPRRRLLGMRTNLFRRLHRKIVAIDDSVAFIGGINFGEDHLLSSGEEAKWDYAVRVIGPLAQEIHSFARQQIGAFDRNRFRWSWRRIRRSLHAEHGRERLVIRDNDEHRNDIERQYRDGIRAAKREIIIANAYFFPGYRLLRQLRLAAKRGVQVTLLLQGAPDLPQAKTWATMLYPWLLQSGVQILEYCARPLHAKIAVIDDRWCTIGSSNLDPLSLALNLEANIFVYDESLNRQLRRSLAPILESQCRRIDVDMAGRGSLFLRLCSVFAYHATRHFPRWAGWLPSHLPTVRSIAHQNSPITVEAARSSR